MADDLRTGGVIGEGERVERSGSEGGGGGGGSSSRMSPRSLEKTLDALVFDKLKIVVPGIEAKELALTETMLRSVNQELGQAGLESVATEAAAELKALLDGPEATAAVQKLQKAIQIAFAELEYIGDARDKFIAYLDRSWSAYYDNSKSFKAPCMVVTQSSGFGKSRLLRELALEATDNAERKVLYTCARFGPSTGFPAATMHLRDWLFGSKEDESSISRHLQAAYYYTQQNWSTVGHDWLKLFTDDPADKAVQAALQETEKRLWPRHDGPGTKASRYMLAPTIHFTGPGGVLVLAVDEARSLLSTKQNGRDYFRLLRRALKHANERIRETLKGEGGVFAVLVDTNSSVSDLTPPRLLEPSSRNDESKGKDWVLFPPFVLSHTMDVYWRSDRPDLNKSAASVSVYKSVVTSRDATKEWEALVSMGRPLWASIYRASRRDCDENESIQRVLTLAANKLMLGSDSRVESNFDEKTMFGVASLLARVGLRPYPTSALASRAVADFMAILAYVNYENDGLLSSYASDPALALGGTHVWHAVSSALPTHILPQFKKLLLHEALDVGSIGEVVARVVLLLALDACVVLETEATEHSECKFKGQFVSVQTFLAALGGHSPPVMMPRAVVAGRKTTKAFKDWLARWDGWRVGFCHFVQLASEPNEETLWFLLARRAAGVFPRGHRGADLVIPMFRDDKVSLVLVQVKNWEKRDSKYPASATKKLHPSFVFDGENPLSRMSSVQVIRVYVSLREPVPERRPSRYFLVEEGGANESSVPKKKAKMTPGEAKSDTTIETQGVSTNAYTLCIRSVADWPELKRELKDPLPVVPADVAAKLVDMLSTVWDPMGLVVSDLASRRGMDERLPDKLKGRRLSTLMPDEELKEIASRALVRTMGHAVAESARGMDCGG